MPSFIERIILKILHFFMKFLPMQKKIIFMSSRSSMPSKDAAMLISELRRTHKDYLVGHLCVPASRSFGYFAHMCTQTLMLSTSQIIITDSVIFPVGMFRPRKNMFIVQIPPYTGTFKKHDLTLLDCPGGYTRRQARSVHLHRGYDLILASGEGAAKEMSQAYGYNENKIAIHPLPRIELLKRKSYGKMMRERIFAAYPHLRDGRNIVYCPTLRKDQKEYYRESKQMIDLLRAHSDINVIVKNHPSSKMDVLERGVITDHKFTTFEMLFAADAVISDYSDIIFDAAVLRKSIYLYDYDLKEFSAAHPLYKISAAELPGPLCETPEAIEKAVMEGSFDFNKLDRFLDHNVYTGCEKETEELASFIFDSAAKKRST